MVMVPSPKAVAPPLLLSAGLLRAWVELLAVLMLLPRTQTLHPPTLSSLLASSPSTARSPRGE